MVFSRKIMEYFLNFLEKILAKQKQIIYNDSAWAKIP